MKNYGVKISSCSMALWCMLSLFATDLLSMTETRFITPPKLEQTHLSEQVLCHRPMRVGSPRMELELRENEKFIAHNYGHGGSGWTLGPGAAQYVIGLFKEQANITQHDPIAIIGAGALGLFSALELINAGFRNITIYADKFCDLTSHHAGGLFAPVSMSNNSSIETLIDKIGINSYNFYSAVAHKKNDQLKHGATILPAYFKSRTDSGLEPYVVGKVMKPAKDVVLDFKNGTKHEMVAYDDGIFIDADALMNALIEYLRPRVKLAHKTINNIDDMDETFIINCSGIGARQLMSDDSVVSVQGHLIMLKEQNPLDLQYMIFVPLSEEETASGHTVKRAFYLSPKIRPHSPESTIGVLGGSFVFGAGAKQKNEEEYIKIVQQAKQFYGLK